MLTGALQFSVRMAAETESTMTSVERIVEYGSLPTEENRGSLVPKDSVSWPANPSLEVRALTVSHVSNPSEPVLRNITFSVGPGEKVAVAGRTGAGKSTLLNCFLRMLAIPDKSIFIDGISTTDLELSFLRRRLGVIPQRQGTTYHDVDDDFRIDELSVQLGVREASDGKRRVDNIHYCLGVITSGAPTSREVVDNATNSAPDLFTAMSLTKSRSKM